MLGLDVGIFGKMGDDRNGEFLRGGMNALGIRHHLTLDGTASSFATIFVDAHGNRAIYMVRGATAELKPAEIRRRHGAFIRNAHLVSTEISQLPLRDRDRAAAVRARAFDSHRARRRRAALRRLPDRSARAPNWNAR